MVCLRNICINTLHKGDNDDDDDGDYDDDDNNNNNLSATKIILLYDGNFCHLIKNIIPEPKSESHDSVYIKHSNTCVQDMIFKRQCVSTVSNEHDR